MQIFYVFIIVISVSIFSFFIYQLWYIYENKNYIINYNKDYGKFEYLKSANFGFTGSKFDPNISITDPNKKLRCVKYNNNIFALNETGFVSNDSYSISKFWNNLDECISDIFSHPDHIFYSPCSLNQTSDCDLFNTLMTIKF